jgi:hypothetical protein
MLEDPVADIGISRWCGENTEQGAVMELISGING